MPTWALGAPLPPVPARRWRQVRRRPGTVGPGGGGARGGAGRPRCRLRAGPRRGGVLRPQDRCAGPRPGRARGVVLLRPARLPPAGAIQPVVRRSGRARAAGHAAPVGALQHGALPVVPARAACGEPSRVAGPGPGGGAAGEPLGQRPAAGRGRGLPSRPCRRAAQRGRRGGRALGLPCPRPGCAGCPTGWWSATGRPARGRWRSACAAAAPWSRCRSRGSSAGAAGVASRRSQDLWGSHSD